MKSYTLNRTGDRRLAFRGEEIAAVSTRTNSGPGRIRWHELALYRTEGDHFVLAIAYHSTWIGEDPIHEAHEAASIDEVTAILRDYLPLPDGYGFPAGEQYAARQRSLEQEVTVRFDVAASKLLEEFPQTIERTPFLEICRLRGRPLAAYLYLDRTPMRGQAKTTQYPHVPGGIAVDFLESNGTLRVRGVEILDVPAAAPGPIQALLHELGHPGVDPDVLAELGGELSK